MNEKEIKEFINIALGDVAEPRAFVIETHKNKSVVMLMYPGLVHCPKEVIREEWRQAKLDNPKFAELELYL